MSWYRYFSINTYLKKVFDNFWLRKTVPAIIVGRRRQFCFDFRLCRLDWLAGLTEDILEPADNLTASGGGGGGATRDDPRGRREGGIGVLHEGETVADAVHWADLKNAPRH